MITSITIFFIGVIVGIGALMILNEITQSTYQRYLNRWLKNTMYGKIIERDTRVYKLLKQGKNYTEIAGILNLNRKKVYNAGNRLRRHGMIK